MKKIIFVLMVLALGINLYAQKNREDLPDKPIFNKLNLTEEQKSSLEEMRFTLEEKKIGLEAELKKKELELKKYLINDDIEESKVLSLLEEIEDTHSKLKKSKTEHWFDVYKILDANQKNIWKNQFVKLMDRGNRFRDRIEDRAMSLRKNFKERKFNNDRKRKDRKLPEEELN